MEQQQNFEIQFGIIRNLSWNSKISLIVFVYIFLFLFGFGSC